MPGRDPNQSRIPIPARPHPPPTRPDEPTRQPEPTRPQRAVQTSERGRLNENGHSPGTRMPAAAISLAIEVEIESLT
jgi:hypothetical protein